MNLKELGITKEELLERISDKVVDEAKQTYVDNESLFGHVMSRIKDEIDNAIDSIFKDVIGNNIEEFIRNLDFQKTTKWGEPKGEKVTFSEYMVKMAEKYLTEKVNLDGESSDESHSSFWQGKQTRIVYMIHKYLKYEVEKALKEVLKGANKMMVDGLQAHIINQLKELQKKIDVKVVEKKR